MSATGVTYDAIVKDGKAMTWRPRRGQGVSTYAMLTGAMPARLKPLAH
jgi:hypothetical protein